MSGITRLQNRVVARAVGAMTILAIAGLAFMSSTALAAGSITEFSGGLTQDGNWATDLTAGPDGNVWFTDAGAGAIGKITPSGTITEYTAGLPAYSQPGEIVSGPDGNLWFIDTPYHEEIPGPPAIGRITPSGVITEFSAGVNQDDHPVDVRQPQRIVAGPDGNVWFTNAAPFLSDEPGAIGKITPSGSITEYEQPADCETSPTAITVGPDGNLWFANRGSGTAGGCPGIGRITPSGTITEFSTTATSGFWPPDSLTTGPDGNLWFTTGEGIGRITTAGVITSFTSGLLSNPHLGQIIAGADGNLWFSDKEASAIGRITPSGSITMFRVPNPDLANWIDNLVAGPDGNVWFTDYNTEGEGPSGAVGRITPSGQVTLFTLGLSWRHMPVKLAVGPGNSNLWFTDNTWGAGDRSAAIGRLAEVTANASPNPTLLARVVGQGTVSSASAGINCGTSCETTLPSGSAVSLTATPAPGYTFVGWNEDCEFGNCSSWAQRESQHQCSGTVACALTVQSDTEVSATFAPAVPEESSGGDGGGQSGGSSHTSTPPPVSSSPPSAPTPPVAPTQRHKRKHKAKRISKCPKHFTKRKVHGKAKCVRAKKHRKGGTRQKRHAGSTRRLASELEFRRGRASRPRLSWNLPHGASAGAPIPFSWSGRNLGSSHRLVVQKPVGTAHTWKTVMKLGSDSGSAELPGMALGTYRLRIADLSGRRVLAKQASGIGVFGQVPFSTLFDTEGSEQVWTSSTFSFPYVAGWSGEGQRLGEDTVFQVEHNHCLFVHIAFVPAPESHNEPGSTGTLTLVQESREAVSATTPVETIGSLDAQLTPGQPWGVKASYMNEFETDIRFNGYAVCDSTEEFAD